jgi:L-aspartate oxidase
LSPDLIELRNIALVGSLIVACAQRRRESRGLHYNLDHLRRSAAFGRRVMRLRRPAAGGAPLVPGSPGDL